METVGARVKKERESQGISRTELSKLSGVGYSTLAELERGGMQTTTKINVIASVLGVHARWLETGRGERLPAEFRSQTERLDDETMSQGVELLYLLADARPEDKRLQRPSWAMIKIAAKAVKKAEGSPREAMAEILSELSKEM
jgi:transcriptional regulator with XRE-family HTH domain